MTMSDAPPTERRTQQLLRILQLDRAAIETLQTLASHNVPTLLLKGASIARWLYPHDLRAYVDVDILVPRTSWEQAAQAVECLGFALARRGPTGGNWYRASDRVWLDLHETLWGVRLPAAETWRFLWNEREEMQLHGAIVPVLNARARLCHLALHAIQTGNAKTKAAADLIRAVQGIAFEQWQAAWTFARVLQAEQRFAAALRLYAPGGGALADRLGAPKQVAWFGIHTCA
jgi:hypothetical protein